MNINRKFTLFLLIILLSFGFNFPSFAQKSSQPKTGMASWYGSKYHGKATSSGERYNKYSMTAAHRTLPFGTMVKVTNLTNNKSVIVRINDRGPFSGKRIIDVSETAAKKLDFMSAGLGRVAIEVVELPASAPDLTAADTEKPVEEAVEARASTIQTSLSSLSEHVQGLPLKLKALDINLPLELTDEHIKGKKLHRINASRIFGYRQGAEAFNELFKKAGLQGMVRGV